LEAALAETFEKEGFREIAPSSVEYLETYTRGNQHIRDEAIRYLDKNDRLLALRADFTPAIARIVAGQPAPGDIPRRIWYAGSVFRKGGVHHGRYCEFRQIGAELIGTAGVEGDGQIVNLALSCLERLGVTDAVVHINHAGIFRGVVRDLAVDGEGLRLVQSEIDRKDTRGLAARLETLGIAPGVRTQVHALADMVGGAPVLAQARAILTHAESRSAIAELEMLSESLKAWDSRIVFDLSEVDELEYYTGMMFAVVSPRANSELGKGGRYDTLLREFGVDLPAVGFSLSVDTLVELT
jgi:ATP phosphoribosyltransferase regulatory subunit